MGRMLLIALGGFAAGPPGHARCSAGYPPRLRSLCDRVDLRAAGVRGEQELEELADRAFRRRRTGQGQVPLDHIPVPAAVALLDDVAGGNEITDERVRVALGD